MPSTINRRNALLGTVTLPAALAPAAAALAQTFQTGTFSAEPANATDAAWAELQAAKAAYEAHQEAERAFDATLPKHLHPRHKPDLTDFGNREAWKAARAEWNSERALYPANPHEMTDERLDAFCDRINGAEEALLETPAATLADLERKIVALQECDHSDDLHADELDPLLADVQALDAGAAS